jgi:hypothetical protein
MHRLSVIAVFALVLVGCSIAPPGEPVQLLTGWGPFEGMGSCYANFAAGRLVVDPEFGTAIEDNTGMTSPPLTTPVMWRPGYTGRRMGSQIAVFDPEGKVVATTGGTYRIAGGYWSETITPTKENHYAFAGPRVFLACDAVFPAPEQPAAR